jgi:hypothetical protein
MPSPGERGGVSRYRLQTPSMATIRQPVEWAGNQE